MASQEAQCLGAIGRIQDMVSFCLQCQAQQSAIFGVVVNEQDIHMHKWIFGLSLFSKSEEKGRSLVFGTFRPDAAAVPANDALNGRQADASARKVSIGVQSLEGAE